VACDAHSSSKMPTRTEIVITFGEVLDCLPPGKTYRKRYNSFDANIGPVEGNEENLAPSGSLQTCSDMRTDQKVVEDPDVLSVRAKKSNNLVNCDETDDEISFRDIRLNGENSEDGKNRPKRKSNAERFLEDNANYFQLEVLNAKTRSNKVIESPDGDSDEDGGKGGFHTSFLDFLKSKGVEKDAAGRSRHKSADSDVGERPSSRVAHGRSRSSHSRFGSNSRRERSKSGGRARLLSGVDGSELFLSETESDCSVRLSRLDVRNRNTNRSVSPETSQLSGRQPENSSSRLRAKSPLRESSPSGSELDTPCRRSRRGKSLDVSLSESEPEVSTIRTRRGKSREISPSVSEVDGPSTRRRGGKSEDRERDVSLSESEAEAPITRSRLTKSREVSPSESEASLPSTRTRLRKSHNIKEDVASESELDTPVVRTRRSLVRGNRDISLSESEPDTHTRARVSRSSAREVSPSGSEAEVSVRPRRGGRREVSPSGSEASVTSGSYKVKHKKKGVRESEDESDDEESKGKVSSKKEKETPPNKKIKSKKKRSELDKLLEAVDTSFHFETAAAERKRMQDSGLGPLEIDCSDTGSEASCNISNKRKFSDLDSDSNKKRCKESNNLLKTASPGLALKSEDVSGDELESASGPTWDGWEALNSQLELITEDPVEVGKMHFSFEAVPIKESWYNTYQRQDRGDELIFYPSSTTAPFLLPYELPYNTFQPCKSGRRDTDTSRDQSKASSPVRQLGSLARKGRKISECESTDSDETRKKGKVSKSNSVASSSTLDKLGPKGSLLLESNYRVSPRCHASTKSLGVSGGLPGDLDDLAEAYLMQDERELHFPHLLPFVPSEENSNDSFSSGSVNSRFKSESSIEMSKLAANLDTFLQSPEELPCTPLSPSSPAKVPPTRSRVSSDQLLSPKKTKKKKKVSSGSEQPGVSPLDQLVADNVDPVLLDCLEDELPTVPCLPLKDPMDMLDSYSTCTSMSVCNSRWLRPNKRDSLPQVHQKEARLDTKTKKLPSPSKPKRIIIYKDDLPGFSIDSDMEAEKLPVSKRGKAKAQIEKDDKQDRVVAEEVKAKSPLKKAAQKMPINKSDKKDSGKSSVKDDVSPKDNDDDQASDDDSESVESFSSTSSGSKKRRRTNKTGFPSPKKKRKVDMVKNSIPEKVSLQDQTKQVKSKSDQKPTTLPKSGSKSEKTKPGSEVLKATPKKNVSKQLKMDRFITNKSARKTPASDKSKSSSSPVVPLVAGRRSVALKAKNYR